MSAHYRAAGFPQIKQMEEWEHPQHKPSSVCKLMSQKWAYHCIRFVRSESPDTRGGNYTRSWILGSRDYWGHLGSVFHSETYFCEFFWGGCIHNGVIGCFLKWLVNIPMSSTWGFIYQHMPATPLHFLGHKGIAYCFKVTLYFPLLFSSGVLAFILFYFFAICRNCV